MSKVDCRRRPKSQRCTLFVYKFVFLCPSVEDEDDWVDIDDDEISSVKHSTLK